MTHKDICRQCIYYERYNPDAYEMIYESRTLHNWLCSVHRNFLCLNLLMMSEDADFKSKNLKPCPFKLEHTMVKQK